MTFEALWTALRAAERIAEVHGVAVDVRLEMRRQCLVIVLRDGAWRPVAMLDMSTKLLDECTEQKLIEVVEQGVAGALRTRNGAAAS